MGGSFVFGALWLIDNEKANEFNKLFSGGLSIGDEWADDITLVKWEKIGEVITVQFT